MALLFYLTKTKVIQEGWKWCYTSIIPALGMLRQEEHEFEANLG
jgi:hypothetical protein